MQAQRQGLQVLQRDKTCKESGCILLLQGDLHEALEAAVPSPESASSAPSEPCAVADEADAPDGEPAPPDLQCNTKRTYQPSNLVRTAVPTGRPMLPAKLAACLPGMRKVSGVVLPASWQCPEVCSFLMRPFLFEWYSTWCRCASADTASLHACAQKAAATSSRAAWPRAGARSRHSGDVRACHGLCSSSSSGGISRGRLGWAGARSWPSGAAPLDCRPCRLGGSEA